MKRLTTIGEIKNNIQQLDTTILQWMNSDPPESVQQSLEEARENLEKSRQMCESSLKIGLLGEIGSETRMLLNALLDTCSLVPTIAKTTTGNILEAKITLCTEERPMQIRSSQVIFFNEDDTWEILNGFLEELNNHGIGKKLQHNIKSINDLAKLEDNLLSSYEQARDEDARHCVIDALEFILAIKYNQSVVMREQNHQTSISQNLVGQAILCKSRPDSREGVHYFHSKLEKRYETSGAYNINDDLSDKILKNIFPLIKKVVVEVDAWSVPFSIENPDDCKNISLVLFPEMGPGSATAKDRTLFNRELKDFHAVALNFNSEKPGNITAMKKVVQQNSAALAPRAMISSNRFEHFQPTPESANANQYQDAFAKLQNLAKNLPGTTKIIYPCSASCYLFDIRSKRSNWNLGRPKWFSDKKKQTAYSIYKRNEGDFKQLIHQMEKKSGSEQVKNSLQNYLDSAGLPAFREELIRFAREKGENLIKDKALKAYNAAYSIVDRLAPDDSDTKKPSVNSEVTFCAQEFYRMLELAVADALPSGESEYKSLKIKYGEEEIPLWDVIEKEIASLVASWPEWFAILNQSQVNRSQVAKKIQKTKKTFSRYSKIKKTAGEVPTEFKAFNERFQSTAETMSSFALEKISEAAIQSVQRFETQPDYVDACQSLQSVINMDALHNTEEGLPLIDSWQPSRMVEDDIVPEILERISDEVEDLRNIRYPYDAEKPCFWNLALIIRIQVQLLKTLRDRVSRLIAAAENQFQAFFVGEVLRAEILPLVRSSLNDTQFLASISALEVGEGNSWENAGQNVRAIMNDAKNRDAKAPIEEMDEEQPEYQEDEEEYLGTDDFDEEDSDEFEEW